MVKKLPYMQFYSGDWLKDPLLSMCAPATRGIWIDILCAMHERERCGEVTGTVDQLARMTRCTPSEMEAALNELEATGAATIKKMSPKCPPNVPACPPNVTVVCRRMASEHKSRNYNALKKRRQRRPRDVPQMSPPPYSYSYSETETESEEGRILPSPKPPSKKPLKQPRRELPPLSKKADGAWAVHCPDCELWIPLGKLTEHHDQTARGNYRNLDDGDFRFCPHCGAELVTRSLIDDWNREKKNRQEGDEKNRETCNAE